jgi:hypothetical protein
VIRVARACQNWTRSVEIGRLSLYVYGSRSSWTIMYGLLEPFAFTDHRGKRWIVPCRDAGDAQFITDGASFPWWLRFVPGWLVLTALLVRLLAVGPVDVDALVSALWWFCALQAFVGYPIHTAYSEAAVAHDYLYSIGAGKWYADAVFFRMLVARAVMLYVEATAVLLAVRLLILTYRLVRAALMWIFVAGFGWYAYQKHAARSAMA